MLTARRCQIASEKRRIAAADSADDRGPFCRLGDTAGEEHQDPRREAAHRALRDIGAAALTHGKPRRQVRTRR